MSGSTTILQGQSPPVRAIEVRNDGGKEATYSWSCRNCGQDEGLAWPEMHYHTSRTAAEKEALAHDCNSLQCNFATTVTWKPGIVACHRAAVPSTTRCKYHAPDHLVVYELYNALNVASNALRDQPMQAFKTSEKQKRRADAITKIEQAMKTASAYLWHRP